MATSLVLEGLRLLPALHKRTKDRDEYEQEKLPC